MDHDKPTDSFNNSCIQYKSTHAILHVTRSIMHESNLWILNRRVNVPSPGKGLLVVIPVELECNRIAAMLHLLPPYTPSMLLCDVTVLVYYAHRSMRVYIININRSHITFVSL